MILSVLTIHKLHNGEAGDLLYSVDDDCLKRNKEGFELHEKSTGVFIDPYGNTKFSSGLSALISALKLPYADKAAERNGGYSELIEKLEEWERNGTNIIFVGD